MKPINKSQFDNLLERRINQVARALKDQVNTTENNPEHMTLELKAQVIEFLQNAIASFDASLEAIISRPTAGEIGEFSLGGAKAVRRKRRAKTEIEADKTAAAESAATARMMEARPAVQPQAATPFLAPVEEPVEESEDDAGEPASDLSDDIEALFADLEAA